MIFAAILAAGSGSRMNSKISKQYLNLSGKPIFIYSLQAVINYGGFDDIIVAVGNKDISYVENIIKDYTDKKITVIPGGENRNQTLEKIVKYLCENYEIKDDDLLLTHDGARPFVTIDIIKDNIEKAKLLGGATAAVKSTDTIAVTKENLIKQVPDRNFCYNVQTPQTFNLKKLKLCMDKLSEGQKESLTDASKIFLYNNEKVGISRGSENNIKITYPTDLEIGENILKNKK